MGATGPSLTGSPGPIVNSYGPDDIRRLNHYFSTKSLAGMAIDCSEQAKEILECSVTDPLVRASVTSLVLLREDLETVGDDWLSVLSPTASYNHGLEQYNLALRGLSEHVGEFGSQGLRSLLLCCHIFISIEQVRKNYAAFAQHLVRGLNIMNQYKVRPGFTSVNKFMPAQHPELPLLDVFIIKFFAAPCPFAERAEGGSSVSTPTTHSPSSDTSSASSDIIPNVRGELTKIAMRVLNFLDKVSHVCSVKGALLLLVEKEDLLDALGNWLSRVDGFVTQVVECSSQTSHSNASSPALGATPAQDAGNGRSISACFLRFFHQILRVVLLWTLDHSPNLANDMVEENEKLQAIADDIGRRVTGYVTHSGVKFGQR